MARSLKVGDKVAVKRGKAHMGIGVGKKGTVKQISTPAIGVRFEGSARTHKWYTAGELDKKPVVRRRKK